MEQHKWIIPHQPAAVPEPQRPPFGGPPEDESEVLSRLRPARYVRGEFSLKERPERARAFATSHGLYRLWINGARPDERVLAPEVGAFDKEVTVQEYDVTALLHRGQNAVGVILTDGWHIGRIGLTGDSCQYADRLALCLWLEIEYPDGTQETVCADTRFRSSTGALVYSDIFVGERYDARREPRGFSQPGFDDSAWEPVEEAWFPERFVPQRIPPVVKKEEFTGRLIRTPKGETVYDFGQVIAGVERFTFHGAPGDEMKLEHSETLDREGNFLRNVAGHAKNQTDFYVLSSAVPETYEPIGTFHGFRYVKVSGSARALEAKAFAIRTDNRETASFSCSDGRLNRLWENILWSLRGNTVSIPTDCPQRERSGFTGDMQIFLPAACWLMDMRDFVSSWLHTLRLEQTGRGEIPIIAPNFPGLERMQRASGGVNCSAGWGDAIILVPWGLYQAYGDPQILRENYDAMKRWLHFVAEWARTGEPYPEEGTPSRSGPARYLWDTGFSFGDWLVPSRSQGLENPFATAEITKGPLNTAYFARSASLLSQIAGILGETQAAADYAALAEQIRAAYTSAYCDSRGRIAPEFQGVYVTALAFDMLPEPLRAPAAARLAELIAENGDRLDTGFLSVAHLLDALWDNGYQALARRLLFQTRCPSWLYEVEQGATTVWESWSAILPDGTVTTSSMNHYSFGCVADWMMRRLAGLQPTSPGFASLRVSPDFDCGLSRVEASYQSPKGLLRVSWERRGDAITLPLTIPPGVAATLSLPNGERPLPPGETHLTL